MNLWQSSKLLFGQRSSHQREIKTSRALLTIFAYFILSDEEIESNEVEISFDFVRNIFPEVDHGLLGKFLERALAQKPTLAPHLAHLKRVLTKEQRTAFALQLLALINAGNRPSEQHQPFLEIMTKLGGKAIGEAALHEMTHRDAEPSKILPRLDFAAGEQGQVKLAPGGEKPPHFRCYRAGGLILLRNMGESPLSVRGYSIGKDRLIQFRPSDEILASGWRLGYDDLVFFFQNSPPTLYLVIDDGELAMSRSKSRLSIARLTFGRRAQVVPLKNGTLSTNDNQALEIDEQYECDYHDLLNVGSNEPVALETLRRLSLQSGHRFRLPTGRRKVIVSNDHSQLSGDSLLLTPGLSGRFVLELEFDPASGQGEMRVLESTRPITANGQIVESTSLPDGSLIRLSSRQALRCRFSENILDEERNLVRNLEIEGLNYAFWKSGKTIDNLSFHVERGEMVCIIGPSGSGKSTLLEILAGQRKPQSGTIRLNGLSLYERQRRLAPLISFMPQEEALGSQLTVREHLTHACAIRRPHLSPTAIQKRVNHLLDDLGLDHISERPVGSADSKSLSGGERSRLNAGLDLIGGGEIFLFDEPISGLSSKDAEHVVDALRGLARDKIVITSLHRPSEKVLKSFDRVLLLDGGGKMAFFGPPNEMIHYFEDARSELKIKASSQALANEQTGADFVFDILEAPLLNLKQRIGTRSERRFPPAFWQERFENRRVMAHLKLAGASNFTGNNELPTADDQIPAPEPPAHGNRQKWMIFRTHLARAFKSKLRHRGTFYSIFLEAPLLAILIAYTLHASAEGSYEFQSSLHLPSYLFLAVTVAMFFGLTNSATEVLRDRPTLRRERNCRPHPVLYLGSKFLTLTGLVALQSLIFVVVAHRILEIYDMLLPHLIWMTLTGCCGTALALLVSALSRSERTALSAIPLILVPQILLAGALIPFSEMNRALFHEASKGREQGAEPVPSTVMPLRYAFEGSVVSQATQNTFEQRRRPLQKKIDKLTKAKDLSDEQAIQLQQEKDRLGILFAASAHDVSHAYRILEAPLQERERLLSESQAVEEDTPYKPLAHFFVNQRVERLVELAETRRLDHRKPTIAKVFLAEKKSILGIELSTLWYCRLHLAFLTLGFLALAASFLKLSLNRH